MKCVGLLVVVDELAAVRPDERSDPDQRGLDAEPVHLGLAVAVRVLRQLLRRRDHVVPLPAFLREGNAGLLEHVLVVVDDEARDVLREAGQRVVEPERAHRLLVEVLLLEDVRVVHSILDRLQDVAGRELCVEAVVEQEQIGRSPGREGGGQPRDQVVAVARLDHLHVDVRILVLVCRDHVAIRLDLLRIAEDHEAHVSGHVAAAAVTSIVAAAPREHQHAEQGQQDSPFHFPSRLE